MNTDPVGLFIGLGILIFLGILLIIFGKVEKERK